MSDQQLQVAQRTFTRVDEEHGSKGFLDLPEMEQVRCIGFSLFFSRLC